MRPVSLLSMQTDLNTALILSNVKFGPEYETSEFKTYRHYFFLHFCASGRGLPSRECFLNIDNKKHHGYSKN